MSLESTFRTATRKRVLVALLAMHLIFTSQEVLAQSDNCADAPTITVNSDCQTYGINLTGFTHDGPELYTGTSYRDGWFKFTTGATATAVKITAENSGTQHFALSTYLTCSDMTAHSSIVPNNKTAILYAAVQPNTTYYLRVSRTQSSANGYLGTVCIQSINAVVATYTAGDSSTEYTTSEPDANSSNTCPTSLSLNVPVGNAISSLSTFYQIRATSPAIMNQQRSILFSPTLSTGEAGVALGTGTAPNTEKYERHNITFANGVTGNVSIQLKAWRTHEGTGCNTTYNRILNHTWTVIGYYEPSSSCPSPSLSSFQTLSNSTNAATISWEAPMTSPTDGYEYFVSTNTLTPAVSGTHLSSGTQINLGSLASGTNYYLFVRGRCSVSEFGNWIGPYHFNTTVCAQTSQCQYQLHMNNSTPSGWNGTVLGFRQNGVVVATATLSSGSSSITGISLCNNLSTELFVQTAGSYSDEISFTLYDAAGNIETTKNIGSTLTLNNVLDTFTINCPDCHSPSNIHVSYPSSTAINLQWTAPVSVPSNGYEYLLSTSSEFPIGSGTSVNTGTSASVGSLNTSTTYYVFIRSMCSPTIGSAWAGPVALTTSCSESTLTVTEGLNSNSPVCWEKEIVSDITVQSGISPQLEYVSSSLNPAGLSAYEGSGFLRFNSYSCDTGDQIRLVSTPFETAGIPSVEVDFIWSHDPDFSTSNDGVQMQYSYDRINWINVSSFIPRFSANHIGWYPHTVELPASVIDHSHVYVGFLFTGSGGNDCYIDDIVIRQAPECKRPANIKATYLTESFCRIEWTAPSIVPSNGFIWELRASGSAGSGVSGLSASGNSSTGNNFAEIGGLSPLTSYRFYIKSNCGSEQGDWTWVYQFRTVSPSVNVFPFTETFEPSSTSVNSWQNEYSFGNRDWTYSAGAGSGDVTTAYEGSNNARFRATTDITYTTKLVSPPMDLTMMPAGARLKFWFANQSWSGRQNELRVYYKTTYGNNWTIIPGAVYTTNQNSWTEVTLTLPETGTDYYVAFEGLNKYSRGLAVDFIRVEQIECPIPSTDVVAGRNSAFIHWSIPGNTNLPFEWEIRTSGNAGSGAVGLKATSVTDAGVLGRNVSGLTANTTYYLYVRTHCALDDVSLWSPAHEFTTTNITPPANDHFTSPFSLNNSKYIFPNCYIIHGTTVGATPFFYQDYNDVWYSFVASSNGVSIKVTSTFDGAIVLMDANKNIVSTENLVATNQTEILNEGTLIAGNTYYIAVANYRPSQTADGTFNICLQRLSAPWTSAAEYTLCQTLKSQYVAASVYTFQFTPTGITPGTTTTYGTTTAVVSSLAIPQLNLAWGGTYNVKIDGTFSLQNGLGITETVQVPGTIVNEIAITESSLFQLKPSFNCQNTTLTRNSLVYPVGVTQSVACGAQYYTAEFTRVYDCAGSSPNEESTFTVNTALNSVFLSLNYAFNSAGIATPSNTHAGYWKVRWRVNYAQGTGQYGPAQIIKVNNTSPSFQGMTQEPSISSGTDLTQSLMTSVYPNPNNGEAVNIHISGTVSTGEIKILDSVGRTIYRAQITVSDKLNTEIIFAEKLSAGLYIVEYNIAGQTKNDKLLVVK